MNSLHAIRPPIAQERIDAAKVVLAMYRRDYGPTVRMTFESEPRRGFEAWFFYWCHEWNEDRWFHIGMAPNWGQETIEYFLRESYESYYDTTDITENDVLPMFIERAEEKPWTGPVIDEGVEVEDEEDMLHTFEPIEGDEDFCNICNRTFEDGPHE